MKDIKFRRLQARDMLWTGPISNTYVEVVQCEISVEFRDIEGYWDLRQQIPVHTQQLSNRCYALLVKHPLMVVGTADRNLTAFNFPNQVQQTFATPGSDGAFNFWDKDSKQRLKINKPSKKDAVSSTGLDEPSS
ncbi:RAE1-like protein isoform X2 [Tanacetum coccineum]